MTQPPKEQNTPHTLLLLNRSRSSDSQNAIHPHPRPHQAAAQASSSPTHQLVANKDFPVLAKNLSQTMFQLGWFYSSDVETEAYVRGVLKRVHDYFFRNSWLDGWDGVCSYELSKEMLCRYPDYRIPGREEPDNESYGVGAERID